MVWRRGQTYSQDLRDRVLGADTLTARQAAARFGVSVSYVVKARQRLVTRISDAAAAEALPGPQARAVSRRLAGAGGTGAGRDAGRASRVACRDAWGCGGHDDRLEGAQAAQADTQKKSLRASRTEPNY